MTICFEYFFIELSTKQVCISPQAKKRTPRKAENFNLSVDGCSRLGKLRELIIGIYQQQLLRCYHPDNHAFLLGIS